jgi:peptidoglycan/LPS O-acetylase OafA/YrhL
MKLTKLEAIRGFAAFYVAVGHLVLSHDFFNSSVKFIFRFGQEAVILFFLLSGFVIYLSIHKTCDLRFKDYFIKRFRRIYPTFIISILITLFVVAFNNNLSRAFSWQELLGNLFMLQDFNYAKPGGWVNTFLGNSPLWSLSYEWWFYLIFYPIYKVLPQNNYRIYFVLTISIVSWFTYLIFPNHASLIISYLIIWWAGLESAVVFTRDRRFTYRNMKHILICLFMMLLVSFIPLFYEGNYQFGIYPVLTFRHFLSAFFFMVLGLIWWRNKLLGFDKMIGSFSKIAPISYSLYLFHYPLLIMWDTNLSFSNVFGAFAVKIVCLVGLAYLTEIKLQPVVNRLLKV